MVMNRAVIALAALAWMAAAAAAQEFKLDDVASATTAKIASIAPGTVLFTDNTEHADATGGLILFDDWGRTRPQEQKLLNLYPGYSEPVTKRKVGRTTKSIPDKLAMYVATARFTLARTMNIQDINRYATLAFAEKLDPSITEKAIKPEEITPLTNPKFAHNLNPARPWCVGIDGVCIRSHYRLEGKLPLGIALANKLRDPEKKIADYLEFESEIAVRPPDAYDQDAVRQLTHLDSPMIGALEQSTFYVNQILQFAKFLVVFQADPADAHKTVVTAFMALAIQTKVLDIKKEYARVPVLRNLVPMQVLMGKSSFNTGRSISAGLPSYARSRIQTVAHLFAQG